MNYPLGGALKHMIIPCFKIFVSRMPCTTYTPPYDNPTTQPHPIPPPNAPHHHTPPYDNPTTQPPHPTPPHPPHHPPSIRPSATNRTSYAFEACSITEAGCRCAWHTLPSYVYLLLTLRKLDDPGPHPFLPFLTLSSTFPHPPHPLHPLCSWALSSHSSHPPHPLYTLHSTHRLLTHTLLTLGSNPHPFLTLLTFSLLTIYSPCRLSSP
jgi:hypothetical protein